MRKKITVKKWALKQFLAGLCLLFMCGIIIRLASTGITVEEKDITPVVFLAPLGVYLMFTKNRIFP